MSQVKQLHRQTLSATGNNPNQPREDDLVLGGQMSFALGSLVLGGIEGVKQRLASPVVEVRISAVKEALKYGEIGLDLAIQGLRDESGQVQFATYSLLQHQQQPKIKQQLQNYLSWFEFEVVQVDVQGQITNRSSSQAQFFAEDLGKGETLEMVSIPDGSFLMGSPETEEGRIDGESDQHWVTVPRFFMGKYPITQAQWQAVAALPPVNCSLNPQPSYFQGANRPVERVSWHDAQEFCARLSVKTGRSYRLPTEAEWEYAARAGTNTPFCFGETITTDLANYNGSYSYGFGSSGIHRQETTDVSSFPANAFGLHDLHGNVWEWSADVWQTDYDVALLDGAVGDYRDDNLRRLLCGGAWVSNPKTCRSAYRHNFAPGDRVFNIGFRVVCS